MMSVPQFVSGSALLLLVWLGLTFMRDVPSKAYPITPGRTAEAKTAILPAVPTAAVSALH